MPASPLRELRLPRVRVVRAIRGLARAGVRLILEAPWSDQARLHRSRRPRSGGIRASPLAGPRTTPPGVGWSWRNAVTRSTPPRGSLPCVCEAATRPGRCRMLAGSASPRSPASSEDCRSPTGAGATQVRIETPGPGEGRQRRRVADREFRSARSSDSAVPWSPCLLDRQGAGPPASGCAYRSGSATSDELASAVGTHAEACRCGQRSSARPRKQPPASHSGTTPSGHDGSCGRGTTR
jgi:hypothetical protein